MTDHTIVTALISAGATVLAALIAVLGSALLRQHKSSQYRQLLQLPNPLGSWYCDWFTADGGLYVKDQVKIETWLKGARFRGTCSQPNFRYIIEGEFDGTRVMTLTYRAEGFPTKGHVGVACLKLNHDGSVLKGYWCGREKNDELISGRTQWIRESSAAVASAAT